MTSLVFVIPDFTGFDARIVLGNGASQGRSLFKAHISFVPVRKRSHPNPYHSARPRQWPAAEGCLCERLA